MFHLRPLTLVPPVRSTPRTSKRSEQGSRRGRSYRVVVPRIGVVESAVLVHQVGRRAESSSGSNRDRAKKIESRKRRAPAEADARRSSPEEADDRGHCSNDCRNGLHEGHQRGDGLPRVGSRCLVHRRVPFCPRGRPRSPSLVSLVAPRTRAPPGSANLQHCAASTAATHATPSQPGLSSDSLARVVVFSSSRSHPQAPSMPRLFARFTCRLQSRFPDKA